MHKVKHRLLTRDVLKQTGSSGILIGIWLGNKNKLFPYIFDDMEYIFAPYRRGFDWVVQFDLEYIDQFEDFYKQAIFDNLYPYVIREQYDKYKKSRSKEDKYIELPTDRTFVINTHKLKRNQSIGGAWANPSLFDVLHKRKTEEC